MKTTLDNFYTFQDRFEIRDATFGVLSRDIENSSSLIETYETSIDSGDGNRCCGSVLFTRKWKRILSELGFDQQSSSSEGYAIYRLQGKKDVVCNAIVTDMRIHSTNQIVHSVIIQLVDTSNTENPIVTAYSGNIEDFGNKVIRKLGATKIKSNYGL